MRFLRRTKIALHSQVDLYITALEPASATLGEFRGLGNLLHSENSNIELPRFFFFSARHGELDMVNRCENVHKQSYQYHALPFVILSETKGLCTLACIPC